MARSDLDTALRAAIAEHPGIAAEALDTIQIGRPERALSLEGARGAAGLIGRAGDFEQFLLEQINAFGLRRPFVLALVARNVPLGKGWEAALGTIAGAPADSSGIAAPQPEVDDVDDAAALAGSNVSGLGAFENRARAFRCRVLVDGGFAGTGFQVGPSTVMTAWHVISGGDGEPPASIEVLFADGQRIQANVPVSIYSRCSANELAHRVPDNDDEVTDLHDVALLSLARPAGASLGVAELAKAPRLKTHDTVFIAHFPEGRDRGLGVGAIRKMRGLTSRWGHSVRTMDGSSGAGCFTADFRVSGIHQGRAPSPCQGRFVPVSRFPQMILDAIANDEAPATLWSLDGSVDGELVIGRRDFFYGFARASRTDTRVRGLRIKRVNAGADESGIPFTYRMLEQLAARAMSTQCLRISFESVIDDLASEIARRAQIAGLDIDQLEESAGVGIGDTSPDAVATDRGRRIASSLDAAATRRGLRLWIFLEHPSVIFGDALRAALDGFIDQALRLPSLRLVVAGFEAVSLPGVEVPAATAEGPVGPPGLVLEYIEGYTRDDVEHLFRQAARSLGEEPPEEVVRARADDALFGVTGAVNGVYPNWTARSVIENLRVPLRRLRGGDGAAAPIDGRAARG